MGSQKRNKTTVLVICGLLLISSFDICESRKTSSSKNKSKSGSSSSSSSSRTKPSNTQHANPASFSYSNVQPSAPQSVKPSAPVQQKPSYPVQSQPTYNQAPYPVQNQPNYNQPPATNSRPIGWNVDQNKPPVNPPYPVNQPKPNSPPYPTNVQQNSNPQSMYPPQQAPQGPPPAYSNYPSNTNFNNPPPAYSQHPVQGPPPAYSNVPHNPQFNSQPAYNPQQSYNPQSAYNPQQAYNPQPAFIPNQQPQFIPVQQQTNSGPGLVKTALVAGAAGLGGAALYNAFKSDSDPKTTVIYVNNTQPIAATGDSAPQPVAPQPEQTALNNPVMQPTQPEQTALNNPVMQALPQPIEIQPDQAANITMMQAVPNIPMLDIVTQAPSDSTTPNLVSSSEDTVKKDDMAANATDLVNAPASNLKPQEIVGAEKLPNTAEKASNGISSLRATISIILLSVTYTLF